MPSKPKLKLIVTEPGKLNLIERCGNCRHVRHPYIGQVDCGREPLATFATTMNDWCDNWEHNGRDVR